MLRSLWSLAFLKKRTSAAVVTSTEWRINITARQSAGDWSSLAEVEMRESAGGADACTGGTASASHASGSFPASQAFDNNTSTLWASGTNALPNWLQYTFAAPVSIVQLSLRSNFATDSPTTFDIQYWDGGAWVTSWSVASSGTWSNNETKVFTKP